MLYPFPGLLSSEWLRKRVALKHTQTSILIHFLKRVKTWNKLFKREFSCGLSESGYVGERPAPDARDGFVSGAEERRHAHHDQHEHDEYPQDHEHLGPLTQAAPAVGISVRVFITEVSAVVVTVAHEAGPDQVFIGAFECALVHSRSFGECSEGEGESWIAGECLVIESVSCVVEDVYDVGWMI